MKASKNCTDIIKRFEGLYLKSYLCPAGKLTIGYGHTKGVKPYEEINELQAEIFLREDLQEVETALNRLELPINQNQYDALVSFAFNLGKLDQLTDFGTRTIDEIADAIPNYNKAGGVVVSGLVKRRRVERMVFLSPTSRNS